MAIALGSNQGDRLGHLRSALGALRRRLGPLLVGPLVRSAPEGGRGQRDYYNSAIVAQTALEPEDLLAELKALELAAGRRRGERNAPRPLDLDLLLYGSLTREDPELTVPHARLLRRPFVLVPLAAIAPDWIVPPGHRTVASLASEIDPTPLTIHDWPEETASRETDLSLGTKASDDR